jgi:urease accessory protein
VDPRAARSDDGNAVLTVAPASGWTGTAASIRLCRGVGGKVRVEGTLCTAPLWFRWDGATLWLVGSGASPAGEDRIRVRVQVDAGVTAAVRAVAATVVYAARGMGTRWSTELHVACGANLSWRPEPVILTEHARHEAVTTVHAETGARLLLDDVLVLGRSGEPAGDLRSTMDVRIDGTPTTLTSFDTSLPGWSGPGGADGAKVIATRLRLGDDDVFTASAPPIPRAAVLRPAPGCTLVTAAADDVAGVRRMLHRLAPDE